MAFYQWRAYVGPRYNHYTWTGTVFGQAIDGYGYGWHESTRQLTAEIVDHTVTSIPVTDSIYYPSAGGVWVYGSYGTAGEYVQYTGKSSNTLTPAIREPDWANNHGGYHEQDEWVSQWLLLDDDDGTLRFSLSMDSTLTATTWEGSLQGFKGRHWALRNNHLIVVQTRSDATGAWANHLVGVIDNPGWRDDVERTARWSLKIRSVEHIWAREKIKGVRVGSLDLASGASATSTAPLVLASDERDTGDYVIAAPDFDAGKAIDGDTKTLWIAEKFKGSPPVYSFPNGDTRNNGDVKFSQLYINPPIDAPPDSRWIELVFMTNVAHPSEIQLYSATNSEFDAYHHIQIDLTDAAHNKVVMCEDELIFQQYNPHAEPTHLIENRAFFQHIDPTGGSMRIRMGFGGGAQWLSWVEWGHGNGGINEIGGTYGTPVTAPLPGQNMRYIHNATGDPHEYWQVGKVHNAGYEINADQDVWLLVTLPELGLLLRDDISSALPNNSQKLYLVDKAGNPTTAGLPASGTIQIGSERIAYAAKDFESVTLASSGSRGASSTTAADHVADDAVFYVDGGVATDAHVIQYLGWRRYGLSIIYPHHFKFYVSKRISLRQPDDENLTADFTLLGDLNNHLESYWIYLDDPLRVRQILIKIGFMTAVDPSRPRINEIEAALDPAFYLSDLWLVDGVTVYAALSTLAEQAGLPVSVLVDGGSTPTITRVETGSDAFWTVAVDLAEFTGCTLSTSRVGKITLAPDTFWTGSPSYTHTWDETTITAIEKVDRNDLQVRQVRQPWRNAANTASGTEVYPAAPGLTGEIITLSEQIYSSSFSAQTAARKKFIQQHYPYTVVIEAASAYPTMAPGEVHRVRWEWNLTDGIQERLYLVTGVDHWIEDSTWYTTVYLQQIERVIGF